MLQEAGSGEFGFRSGRVFVVPMIAVPSGEDLDRDAYAAAQAIDDWVARNVPEDRAAVPIGFRKGGLLAIHLLRPSGTVRRVDLAFPAARAGESSPVARRPTVHVAELNIPVFCGLWQERP